MFIIDAIMNVALRLWDATLTMVARAYVAVAWQGYRVYAFAWKTRSLGYKQAANGLVFGLPSLLLVWAIYLNTLNGGITVSTVLGDLLLFCGVFGCWLLLAVFDSALRKHELELQLAMARQAR